MHHGLLMEDGQVLHNTPFQGEHVSSYDDFSKGKHVHHCRTESTAASSTDTERLREAINRGRRYNPFTNNCEHTVNRIVSGQARSSQLEGIAIGSIGFIAAIAGLALTRNFAVAAVGFKIGTTIARRFRTRRK